MQLNTTWIGILEIKFMDVEDATLHQGWFDQRWLGQNQSMFSF